MYYPPQPLLAPKFPGIESTVDLFDVLSRAEPGWVGCSTRLSMEEAQNGEHTGWVYRWEIWAEPCMAVAGASAGGWVGVLPVG